MRWTCGSTIGRGKHLAQPIAGEISSSGYVVHALEAALWAIDETKNFEDALILAVNLADDSDTVGAVTGQLAGALYGYAMIPERWLAPLAWRDDMIAIADKLITGPHAES
jgi:ADP-ribosyl-[dinitrogen reductase] hydrolase